jgi:ribonucleoside-diphosphate reductase beta chain
MSSPNVNGSIVTDINEIKLKEKNEMLLAENKHRFVLLPIQHQKVWDMYKKHEASFWTAEEIDMSNDYKDWQSLSDDERHFIKVRLHYY